MPFYRARAEFHYVLLQSMRWLVSTMFFDTACAELILPYRARAGAPCVFYGAWAWINHVFYRAYAGFNYAFSKSSCNVPLRFFTEQMRGSIINFLATHPQSLTMHVCEACAGSIVPFYKACLVFFYMCLQSMHRVALCFLAGRVPGIIMCVYRAGAGLNYTFVYRARPGFHMFVLLCMCKVMLCPCTKHL